MEGAIITDIKNNVAQITFGHPAHNSLPTHLLEDLCHAILTVGDQREITAIVLQSEGNRTFCSGANFKELASIQTYEEGRDLFLGFANVINAIRICGKLVIGRVQGKVVGGGVGLATACDYCMATKWGSLRLSELNIGIGPFVISPSIERKISKGHFTQLALNPGEWQTAEWAHRVGIYQELFDEIDQLDDYLKRYLDQLRGMSPQALAQMKSVLWQGTDHWNDLLSQRAEMSGRLIVTNTAQLAIRNFL